MCLHVSKNKMRANQKIKMVNFKTNKVMRTEMKLALSLFAINMILGHLLTLPEFIQGLFIGLFLFFMIIGLLQESAYSIFKEKQSKKLSYLKRIVRMS